MFCKCRPLVWSVALLLIVASVVSGGEFIDVPEIDGKWAPEVIEHEGQFYIAGYGRGLHVARLQWHQKTREEVGDWRKKWLAYLSEEQRKRLERDRLRREGP